MKKLIEDCKNHEYVYLRDESVPISHPTLRLVKKEVYACLLCGTGLDCYNLDEPIILDKQP